MLFFPASPIGFSIFVKKIIPQKIRKRTKQTASRLANIDKVSSSPHNEKKIEARETELICWLREGGMEGSTNDNKNWGLLFYTHDLLCGVCVILDRAPFSNPTLYYPLPLVKVYVV